MSIFDKAFSLLESELDRRLDLYKGEPEETLEKKIKSDGGFGRKGLMFDPFMDQGSVSGLFRPKGVGMTTVSTFILKMMSRRNPVVSTILHVRASEVSTFCRPQASRFDVGFKIKPKEKSKEMDDAAKAEINEIEEFIINCGRKENRSFEDKLTFDQFGYMVAWDWLTYGHTAIETIRDRSNRLYAMLPLPAESIYHANKKLQDQETVKNLVQTYKETYENLMGKDEMAGMDAAPLEDYSYIQVINGKVVEGFTRSELLFEPLFIQTDIDLMGYGLSPLERALSMVTSHLQIENHQRMFFTHGVASRGLLVIQGDVTPNQLRTLQAQWTNQVTGGQSAWRTPILAGIEGVQWVPLTAANRDMEYAAYQDHVLRVMHACFAIDPEQTGFGYLSKGVSQKSLGESSNEWKVSESREKGLRPILSRLEAIINERILPMINPAYAKKYDFCFVGLDAETRAEEIQRLQAEVQLHTSINEIRKEAELENLPVGGNLILNPLLLDTMQKNMSKGEFMERFMGVQGASKRPDLQYIPDPFWFQWAQMQMQIAQGQGQLQGQSQGQPQEGQENQPQQNPGIDRFIEANPELFKSMMENLKKSEINDAHVEEMSNALVKDFEKASEKLIKEILSAVKEDVEGRIDDKED